LVLAVLLVRLVVVGLEHKGLIVYLAQLLQLVVVMVAARLVVLVELAVQVVAQQKMLLAVQEQPIKVGAAVLVMQEENLMARVVAVEQAP
jgi:hypothetical protein